MGMMDRPLYFDRQGQPIELMDWARKMEDDKYRRLAFDWVGRYSVSTIWEGLDRGMGWYTGRPPLIFSTAVLTDDEWVDVEHYATEALAIHGHDQIVARYRSRVSG